MSCVFFFSERTRYRGETGDPPWYEIIARESSAYEIVETEPCVTMSSSGEFSTLSSGEATGTGDDSLPSSREATAEAASSGAGFMPLREFLDRFSLPRVVRVEGAGGRPILLYKQQQRSLRVTATLLMHRYRHDVKVGPEIVIPEGYPGESIGFLNFLPFLQRWIVAATADSN